MYKKLLLLILILPILFSCINLSSDKKEEVVVEPTEEEKVMAIYEEALKALNEGDAFYAGKKFREAESLMPQSKWAAKASLMVGYADYSRNSYTSAVFALERYIQNYPTDKNIPYAHYLIAICYYEQILDEKKDLQPLLKAKKKFEFIIQTYPNTDYATDSRFKLDLITDQLAAKEMSIARFYMKTQKWIPALNRLKTVTEKYDKTVFIEEALHRLVEVYYKVGLENEAKAAAALLGYNYNSSEWYKQSYKILNRDYKIILSSKKSKKKNDGLIKRTIKKLTGK